MALLQSTLVPPNSGRSFELRNGQVVRVAGRSVVDFVAFNLDDLTERFDQARTKSNQARIWITSGDVLFSKRNRPLLTIVRDTFVEGHHDLQKGMCSRERFRLIAAGGAKRLYADGIDRNPSRPEDLPDHGCWENLIAGLDGYGIADEDIPSPFNIFQDIRIDPETGALMDTAVRPAVEGQVDLRAEMNCLVAVSACPQSGRGEPQALRIEIHDGVPVEPGVSPGGNHT
jgi:uncharacterized protein YcgI (DUF1989 family)